MFTSCLRHRRVGLPAVQHLQPRGTESSHRRMELQPMVLLQRTFKRTSRSIRRGVSDSKASVCFRSILSCLDSLLFNLFPPRPRWNSRVTSEDEIPPLSKPLSVIKKPGRNSSVSRRSRSTKTIYSSLLCSEKSEISWDEIRRLACT